MASPPAELEGSRQEVATFQHLLQERAPVVLEILCALRFFDGFVSVEGRDERSYEHFAIDGEQGHDFENEQLHILARRPELVVGLEMVPAGSLGGPGHSRET